MILRLGDKGPDVQALQRRLKAAGYDPGAADGDYGNKTAAAVLAFQVDRPDLEDDRVAGPATLSALEALELAPVKAPPQIVPVGCDVATWDAFLIFVDMITSQPVRYGPGRGLWDGDRFLVTYSPGRRTKAGDLGNWPNAAGETFPSLHCTSFTNLFLSWLLRRNELFTHAGNIPSLFELCKASPELHQKPNAGPFRGFAGSVTAIEPDGSGVKRVGVAGVVDMREMLARARAGTLPTFIVFGQSTKVGGGRINWWHHTGVLACRNGSLFRIAADGSKGAKGYSANPIKYIEINDDNVDRFNGAFYQVYGVDTVDGSYGDTSKRIASIGFEE